MLARVPVLAANSGGPVETVVDGRTGWLRDPREVGGWTDVMVRVSRMKEADVGRMGRMGEERVRREFGRDKLAERLEGIVDEMVDFKRPPPVFNAVLNFIAIALVFVLGLATASAFTRLHG